MCERDKMSGSWLRRNLCKKEMQNCCTSAQQVSPDLQCQLASMTGTRCTLVSALVFVQLQAAMRMGSLHDLTNNNIALAAIAMRL